MRFDEVALEDLHYWVREDRKMALRIFRLIDDIARDPFDGLGKPEPLKHELAGSWSRRIDGRHRLVYRVEGDEIRILACRSHYGE